MAATTISRPAARWQARLTRLSFAHGLAVVVVVALALRVALVLGSPHYIPRTDAIDFDRVAVSLARHGHFPDTVIVPGRGPTALRPPLFPIALAGVYKLVGTGSAATRWEAGRLLEAVLGAVTVVLIGLIARRLWGRRVGLLAGGVAAVYPPLVLIGSSLLTESLFIPLVLAAVLSGLVARDSAHRVRWAVATGVLLALAALTRGNGIVLVVPLAVLVWNWRPRLSRRALAAPAALVAAMVLTLTPWTVRNWIELHDFVPVTTEVGYATAGTYNTLSAHLPELPALWIPPIAQIKQVLAKHPGLNEAQVGDRLNTLGIDYAEAHPGYDLKELWESTLRLLDLSGPHFEHWAARYEAYPVWLAVASVYAFWVVGLVALGGALTLAARRAPGAFWWCPVMVFLTTVVFLGSTRYRSPADPFVIMLAALGLTAAGRRLRTGRVGHPRPRFRLASRAE